MATKDNKVFFAPELFINNGVKDISFYEKAFGATEQLRFSNDDGSITGAIDYTVCLDQGQCSHFDLMMKYLLELKESFDN